jgi:hypothetical protein
MRVPTFLTKTTTNKSMQTLLFNTTTKFATLYAGKTENSEVLYRFQSVPTVKREENYYEVMEEILATDGTKQRFPVARFPVANTNMIIVK